MDNKENKIFISHSKKDREIALRLIERLSEHGLEVWFDEFEIKVGDKFIDKIYSGIKECKYLAIILTKNSVISNFVNEELNFARLMEFKDLGIKILPLLFENCSIPDSIKLLQYGNFTQFETGLNQLLHLFGKVDIKKTILSDLTNVVLKPKIIIGLGTTAVVTISYIKQMYRTHILKEYFRFIAFDTYADIGKMQNLEENEFISGTADLRSFKIADEKIRKELENYPFDFVTQGAGGIRSVGRLAFQNNRNEFNNKFNSAVIDLSKSDRRLSFHIIAALTGGTGAGSLFECAKLIKMECYPFDIELIAHIPKYFPMGNDSIMNLNYSESISELERITELTNKKEIYIKDGFTSPLFTKIIFYEGESVSLIVQKIVKSIMDS